MFGSKRVIVFCAMIFSQAQLVSGHYLLGSQEKDLVMFMSPSCNQQA